MSNICLCFSELFIHYLFQRYRCAQTQNKHALDDHKKTTQKNEEMVFYFIFYFFAVIAFQSFSRWPFLRRRRRCGYFPLRRTFIPNASITRLLIWVPVTWKTLSLELEIAIANALKDEASKYYSMLKFLDSKFLHLALLANGKTFYYNHRLKIISQFT